MLPLPPVRGLTAPTRVRKAIKAVDDYTLWAFNPPVHLTRRTPSSSERARRA